jgi:2-oxoisovalerate dehydrogenase E1 component
MTAEAAGTAHDLLTAYRQMVFIRGFEERCMALSKDVIAGSVHLCAGQEAIPVGARAALRDGDRAVATYRGHGWALAWGVPPEALLREICHRAGGVNGGRAGSALVMSPETGFVGENSIVGAGLPIACGVALAAQRRDTDAVVAVSFGDGAINQGATAEAFAFAAASDLPVIFVCENNGWSEMTPISRTVRAPRLTERARGFGLAVHEVDGNDVEAVEAVIAEAATHARAGRGPVFVECTTVRLLGHYNRDIEHYRTKEEREADQLRDPLPRLREALISGAATTAAHLDGVEEEVAAQLDALVASVLAADLPDELRATDHVVAGDTDYGLAGTGPSSSMSYAAAVNGALRDELSERPGVLVYGEDVGHAGGIFGVTRRLQREFGSDRVFDTPISEAAILGSAVGASLEGMQPIVEIMWGDFLLVALDQLVNQAANVRYVTEGRASAPLVVRTQQGATPGSCPQHAQSLEALLAHVPGLKIGLPATPQDAYSMLRAAVADPDPCVIIEARGLYQLEGVVDPSRRESVGGAVRRREGDALAMITWGTSVHTCLAAAEALAADGISALVLDLRWLSPLDDAAIDAAVRDAGGRVMVVHEANRTGGFGAEVAARIAESSLDRLDAPIVRVGARNTRIPASPHLQRAVLPTAESVEQAARRLAAG